MTTPPQLRVLFFDVFGTCVAQIPAIADEFSKAAKESLESDAQINDEVRTKAAGMSYEQWMEFGVEWNKDIDKFTKDSIKTKNSVDWRAVDAYRLESLYKLLAQRGLITTNSSSTPEQEAKEGSLWTTTHLQSLVKIWHRLPPWPDTIPGLTLLNTKYTTVTLSNTYTDLMNSLVSHSSIPFTSILTADDFHSFKPRAEVYLGAAARMGVKPEECALVAAHLYDLKAAKECGFYAVYVERELEEKNPEARGEGIPDVWVRGGEGGFVAVAERLGVGR